MIETKNKKVTIAYIFSFMTIFMFMFSQNVTQGVFGEIGILLDKMRIKYVLLFVTCVLNIIALCGENGSSKLFPKGNFRYEFNQFFKYIMALAIITLIYQLKNGFRAFAISEILYLVTPLFFVVLLISTDSYNVTRLLNGMFYALIIIFILGNIQNLTIQKIMSIDFLNSYSPFESELANVFILFELYFLAKKQKKKAIVCIIMSFLNLKRIALLKGILLIVLWPQILKLAKNKKVLKIICYILMIFFIILPFIMEIFYSPNVATILSDKYDIDLNQLTMDRYRRTTMIFENRDDIAHGLGSITDYLSNYLGNEIMENRSLHCDILRIYLECTILGTIAVVYYCFKATKNNIFSLILMTMMFLEMIFNHPLLGAGNTGLWCIIYLMIFYYNNMERLEFY